MEASERGNLKVFFFSLAALVETRSDIRRNLGYCRWDPVLAWQVDGTRASAREDVSRAPIMNKYCGLDREVPCVTVLLLAEWKGVTL